MIILIIKQFAPRNLCDSRRNRKRVRRNGKRELQAKLSEMRGGGKKRTERRKCEDRRVRMTEGINEGGKSERQGKRKNERRKYDRYREKGRVKECERDSCRPKRENEKKMIVT